MSAAADTSFHRPPREYPDPVPQEPLRIGPPPTVPPPHHYGLLQTLFPVVGGVGLLGFALIFGNSLFLIVAGIMIVLLLAFSVGMRWSQRRQVRKRAAEDARRYASYLRDRDDELAEAGELQRRALARLYPDPGRLWAAMVKRRGVWERRPDHADFLHVRLGRGTIPLDRRVALDLGTNPLTEYQAHPLHEARRLVDRRATLRGEPVVVDLAETGVVAVTGARARARGFARGLATQLAAWRAPHDLRIVTAFEPGDAAEWEWGKWLPHQRADAPAQAGSDLPMLTFARSAMELDTLLEAELGPRLEQLRRIAESELAGRQVPLNAHTLVVVIDGWHAGHPARDLPAVRELLARARELQAVLVLLVDEREQEPPEVDARLAVPERGQATWERTGPDAPRIGGIALDEVDVGMSESIARALAPIRLEEGGGGERGLAADVRLIDLLGLRSADELDPEVSQRPRPRSIQLRAPVGVRADGERLELDLKQAAEGGMGPHGIMVGATGSGKSELLRTLVAGMAIRHDPESLSFVLVDFKGNATFAALARLPHVAGVITNLESDPTLIDRMRDALVGEQTRRQQMLLDAGEFDDIVAYETRRRSDPSLPPMPNLLVVVDEFAELLAARPEFIDVFVSLGRVGRSLGMHLLLASQRLDEGRLRGLESHLRYRICLRTYSTAESKMVLGTPDAYLLPSLPGLGYLKVDTEVYTQFRAALSTVPHREAEPDEAPAAPVEVVEFAPGGGAGAPPAPPAIVREPEGRLDEHRTDLEELVARLARGREGAPKVHQVWLPPLPGELPLDAAEGEGAAPWWERHTAAAGLAVTVGTVDVPTEQRMEPLTLDLEGAGGHVAIVGAPQTGKSTLLRTLMAAAIRRHSPDEVAFYVVDLGGGALDSLAAAPHVGGVVGKLDREAVERIVRQLRTEVDERAEAFRRIGAESIAAVREARAAGRLPEGLRLPDVFLLIDGWGSFRRDFEGLDREVEELAASGLNFGVHVVVTATRWADIRLALLDNLGARLELRLNDPSESDVSRAAAQSLPAGIAGRGLTGDGLHFQAALPRADGVASSDGLGEAAAAIAQESAAHWDGPRAEPIRLLPALLEPAELPPPSAAGIPIGLEERALSPVALDLLGADPHLLVFGDAESGKSSLLRLVGRGLAAALGPEELKLVVVDVRRALVDLGRDPHVLAYAGSPGAVAPAIEEARRLVEGRAAPLEAAPGPAAAAPAWSGPRVVVLFDDYDLVAGPTVSPLAPLLDLLALGREIGLHVVLARRVAGSARGSFETGFQRLRELGAPGLVLSGEPNEGVLVGSLKAEPQPPGRGHLVLRGRRPLLVQTAFARPPLAVAPSPPAEPGHGAVAG